MQKNNLRFDNDIVNLLYFPIRSGKLNVLRHKIKFSQNMKLQNHNLKLAASEADNLCKRIRIVFF